MGSNSIVLAVRFLLELSALAAMGIWGWRSDEGWLRFLLAIGVPLIAAALWGTFAVPNDPSRSGKAPIPVPGILRLLLELAIFGLAVWAIFDIDYPTIAWALGIIVALHYVVSYDRIVWLLKQ